MDIYGGFLLTPSLIHLYVELLSHSIANTYIKPAYFLHGNSFSFTAILRNSKFPN